MSTYDPDLGANALQDVRDLAVTLQGPINEAEWSYQERQGYDLALAALHYVKTYTGGNTFVTKVRGQGSPITQGQAVVLLNIYLHEQGILRRGWDANAKRWVYTKPDGTAIEVKEIADCEECKASFSTYDERAEHMSIIHGQGAFDPAPVIAEKGEAKAVIADTTSKKGLDLSNLPDGRYAAPDTSGKHDYVFIMVKRVKRTHSRDRRYVYGKIVTGNEVVVAGTIEVKLWSSDSKELVGEQKPDDVYRGALEPELSLIMSAPQAFGQLFGKLMHYCTICGKALTDEESRAYGTGMECWKKEQAGYWKRVTYTYVGADRPDPTKADPNDEKYRAGIWTSYVKPPPPPA